MKKPRAPFLRGLTVQLLAVTVLPLTLLLLLIAFGSVSLHQRDMRALVGERDERAVQAAAAAMASELHHRAANIMNLVALAEAADDTTFNHVTEDLLTDFDGGLAYFALDGNFITSTGSSELWKRIAQNQDRITSVSTTEPVFSSPVLDPGSNRLFVIVSAVIPSRDRIVAGAFSPETLARNTLISSYPDNTHVTVFLLDSTRQILFATGPLSTESIHPDHPGVDEALRGESGSTYLKQGDVEHVVAYSAIAPTGWDRDVDYINPAAILVNDTTIRERFRFRF